MLFQPLHKPLLTFAPETDGGSGGTSGTSTSTTEPDKGKDNGAGEGKKEEEKKFFTQKELDYLFTDRTNRAKTENTAEILRALGVKTVDEAKDLIAKQVQADEANKTELQRAQDEAVRNKQAADEALAEAEKVKAEARQTLMKAEITKAVVAYKIEGATFRPEAIDDVWLRIDRETIKDDGKGGFTGIAEAVAQVAKDRPHWLQTSQEQTRSHGTPRSGGGQQINKGSGNSTEAKPPSKPVTL